METKEFTELLSKDALQIDFSDDGIFIVSLNERGIVLHLDEEELLGFIHGIEHAAASFEDLERKAADADGVVDLNCCGGVTMSYAGGEEVFWLDVHDIEIAFDRNEISDLCTALGHLDQEVLARLTHSEHHVAERGN